MIKKIVVFTFTTLLISCSTHQEKDKKSTINFEVNKGTEFLITAFNLAIEKEVSDEYKPCETSYTKNINSYFTPFKDHPFLQYIFDNVNSGTAFASLGLSIIDFQKMEFSPDIKTDIIKEKIYSSDIEKFKKLAASFYKDTNFEQFFNQNKSYYKNAISKIQEQVQEEKIFQKIKDFYQDKRQGLEFLVFVELTNNSESQAVDFYDNYNPKKRAITLGNFCELGSKSTPENTILDVKNYRDILCHEISHLYTTSLFLDKYIGTLNDFKPLFSTKLSDIQIKDQIDHYIIYPLQGILSKKIYNNLRMDSIFRTQVKDVRKDIYLHFSNYDPKGNISFESYYKEAIELIRKAATRKIKEHKE